MCGIFGAINTQSFFNSENYVNFVKATDIISYRGPDSAGYLGYDSLNNKKDNNKFNIFLGHRRLSIIDLTEDGNMPMEDEGMFIVFNGEIFNYIELKNELRSKYNEQFKTATDTEVILKIYKHYGEDGFSNLNGMWSFILLDTINSKVIISRDRFSIKPLYYYVKDNIYYFSSEIKQLLPFSEKRINKDVMFKYFQQNLVDYDHNTFFKDIFRIKAKTNFIIDLKSKKTFEKTYWDYHFTEFSKNDDIYNLFYSLFYDSVKIRLRSDVKIGTLLSGGLDSSAISLIAKEITNNNMNTYSVVTEHKKISEEKYIDYFVKSTNIYNKKLFLNTDEILLNIDKIIWHQEQPFTSFSIAAHNLILEKIKTNTDIIVVLSGQGGDELLFGYLKYYFYYLKELLKKKSYFFLLKEVLFSLFMRTMIIQFRIDVAKRYIPGLIRKKLDYLTISGELQDIWTFKDLMERQKLDIDRYSVPSLNHYEDKNSMAHSLEIRTPFLDHRLVDFMINVKENLKINNGWSKYILRKSVPLPKEIKWRRDKQGFILPEEYWLKNELVEEIKDVMSNSILHEYGIINKIKFLDYYKKYLSGSYVISTNDIIKVLIAEKWAKIYL